MKKLLLLAVTLATVMTTQAQDVRWGIKAGTNMSNVLGDGIDGTKNKFNFVGGAFIENRFTDAFSLSVEALYSIQGALLKSESGEKKRLNTSYINVPLLANFYLTDGLALKTGIQAGIPLVSQVKTGSVAVSTENLCPGKSLFDLSIPVGISYQMNSGFLIDFRYNIGLTKMFKDMNTYNSAFQLTVGWSF